LADAARRRARAGGTGALDARLAEVETARAAQERTAAEAEHARAEGRLATALGAEPGEQLSASTEDVALAPSPAEDALVARALDARPDLAAAREERARFDTEAHLASRRRRGGLAPLRARGAARRHPGARPPRARLRRGLPLARRRAGAGGPPPPGARGGDRRVARSPRCGGRGDRGRRGSAVRYLLAVLLGLALACGRAQPEQRAEGAKGTRKASVPGIETALVGAEPMRDLLRAFGAVAAEEEPPEVRDA